MRLRTLYEILRDIDYEETRIQFSREGLFTTIQNIQYFKSFVERIKNVPYFEYEINVILSSPLYSTTVDSLRIETKRTDFLDEATSISYACEALETILKKMIGPAEDLVVSFKVPEPSDLDDLITIMAKIKKSLSQVIINDKINGKILIKNWETGSFWFDLYLGTALAVKLCAVIAWSGAVIAKKFKEYKIMEQQLRSLEIKNESLKDILDRQKELSTMLVEAEAKNIHSEFFGTDNQSDQIERIKYAITSFAEIIQKGGQVHPSLSAPENVKNLFPDFTNIEQIESKTKLLTDGSEKESSS